MNDQNGPTCGTCRCWVKSPLTNPPAGECRFAPPHVTAVTRFTGMQLQMVGRITMYPEPLEASPACAQYQPRIELAGAAEPAAIGG